jgi:spermidine synthase
MSVPSFAARGSWFALLACFFLSGFAALLYQTAWTREFGAVFGTSELAVATVLAAYMGGLASGAALAGRLGTRVRRPVLVYGLLELGVAVAALAVPLAIRAATALEVAVLGGRELPADAGGIASALFYLLCAFAILLVPTTFMGATLPLLARHAVRSDREVGPRIGALYAINTTGAIGGTLVCGFVLLPALGLRGTVWVGVALNALVFALAATVARGEPEADEANDAARSSDESATPLARAALILPIILLSGAASFGYEVLWTRLLGHVLGGSIYAFATMLASVLVGIAIGGAIGARIATSPSRAAHGFAVAQLATAGLAFAAFRALDFVPAVAAQIGAGGRGSLGANAALAMAILVPPALAIGTTFPFAVRVLARGPSDAGPASARVYAWNTIGAIVGAVGTGFVALPVLRYAGTLMAACGVNLALAAATALLLTRRRALLAAALAGAVALALVTPQEPWRLLLHSPLGSRTADGAVAHFAVGRAATVLVLRTEGRHDLRTNGLPEASITVKDSRPGFEPVAQWLTALPVAARPALRKMLVVGLGGGLALERVPAGVQSIDVVELEPEVLRANQRFAAWRDRDPLADPRLHVRTNDARSALLLSGKRYDAIVSQPSHPWGAGASHLYTREFFTLVRDRLEPGGVFVQWIGLSFVDEDLLRSLLATLRSVFPNVRIYRPSPNGVLFLASAAPLDVEANAAAAIAAAPDDFAAVGIVCAEDLAAALALDDAGTRALAEGAELSTDDRNVLATRSPKVLRAPLGPDGASRLFAPHEPLIPLPTEFDAGYLVRRLASIRLLERAAQLTASLVDPARRLAAQASLALRAGRVSEAGRLAGEASAADPTRLDAREIALAAGVPDAEHAAEAGANGLGAQALLQARRAAARAEPDWNTVRALDALLAAIDPRSALATEATHLRARSRLASGDPAQAREGMRLLDGLLPRIRARGDLRLRAQLADAAGATSGALSTWMELATSGAAESRAAAAARGTALARSPRATSLSQQERDAWLRDFDAVMPSANRKRGHE